MRRKLASRFVLAGLCTVVLSLSSAANPSSSFAYRAECGKCYQSAEGGAHAFDDLPIWYSHQLMDCDAFNACHSNSQSGPCSSYHFQCGGGISMAESVREAFAVNDPELVKRLLAEHPRNVLFDARTGTISIRECDDAVVARIAVPSRFAHEMGGERMTA